MVYGQNTCFWSLFDRFTWVFSGFQQDFHLKPILLVWDPNGFKFLTKSSRFSNEIRRFCREKNTY